MHQLHSDSGRLPVRIGSMAIAAGFLIVAMLAGVRVWRIAERQSLVRANVVGACGNHDGIAESPIRLDVQVSGSVGPAINFELVARAAKAFVRFFGCCLGIRIEQ